MKVVVPGMECLQKSFQIPYVDVGNSRKLLDPGHKLRVADRERFVGTEGGKNSGWQIRLRDRLMMPEVIGGIVSGADNLDSKLLQDSVRSQFIRQHSVCALPD